MPDKRMAPGGPDAILPAFAELHFSFFPGEHRLYPMGVKKLPIEVISLKLNYFLRARAPAAATETTARETARPTKSSAPVSGFGLLVSGAGVS